MPRARAALSDGTGRFFVDEIEVDGPGPGEVLVRMRASGLCHTDHKLLARRPPCVMGHEGAGTIAEVGQGVDAVRVGDGVVLNWAMPCGRCGLCVRGLRNVCRNRARVPDHRRRHRGRSIEASFGLGTMADHAVVPAAAVVPFASSAALSWTTAATFGCCVMTGWGSVVNVARVTPGRSVVVLGAGAVGLCVIRAAALAGASPIVAVDLRESKLEFAKRFGATNVIVAHPYDEGLLGAATQAREICGELGADYAFECTSVPALGAAPLAMVRDGGTAVQISGIEERVNVDMTLFEWDKVYINPLYGGCDPARDFPRLFELHARGALMADALVTNVYGLDQLPAAIDDMLSGRAAKAVLSFDS